VVPRVRFAPSPTGLLHIGGVRTALFNWLFARHEGGEFLLRIENTDTSREVEESVEQIQRSLRWLGLDWDREVAFQLDSMPRHAEDARRLLADGHAYEDDGAIRFRMPDEGVTAWEDAIKGRIEYPNEKLEDLVLLRSDGRPTYNLAAALDDADSGITHVIRGEDHVSNTPKQIRILEALGREVPVYAHVPNVFGTDGRKLSKRHGAVSVEEFREKGYLAAALMNYLALLGWSYDDRTTVYLRGLAPAAFADALVAYLRERGFDGDEDTIRASAPLVQEKISRLEEYPGFAGFFFRRVEPPPELLDGAGPVLAEARETLAGVEPFEAGPIEAALRALAERLGLKPRDAFGPIRAAVTGSKVSPGLFESLELLGRDESLARLTR
jgi:glutamyl-tRNA synthetase